MLDLVRLYISVADAGRRHPQRDGASQEACVAH